LLPKFALLARALAFTLTRKADIEADYGLLPKFVRYVSETAAR
jgi:hypothetical protein